ncbi:MAG: hypothetical protein KJ674_05785 [Nanoarchaeota archaeon]|nr:hypothetical protein [Patescibacteria group bacterium]MBU2634720.1 hypothetical protein [Nanoarchaeota archaeon]
MESFDELLKRDEQREKDGFSKKIKIRRILTGPGKVIAVPFVEEEKLLHGEFEPTTDSDGEESQEGEGKLGDMVGQGEGDVGEVIGKRPLEEGG